MFFLIIKQNIRVFKYYSESGFLKILRIRILEKSIRILEYDYRVDTYIKSLHKIPLQNKNSGPFFST